jgi:hypothetical protein
MYSRGGIRETRRKCSAGYCRCDLFWRQKEVGRRTCFTGYCSCVALAWGDKSRGLNRE